MNESKNLRSTESTMVLIFPFREVSEDGKHREDGPCSRSPISQAARNRKKTSHASRMCCCPNDLRSCALSPQVLRVDVTYSGYRMAGCMGLNRSPPGSNSNIRHLAAELRLYTRMQRGRAGHEVAIRLTVHQNFFFVVTQCVENLK